jgi:hypothetical protein
MPLPSSSSRSRVIPGKDENGPSLSISAMLTRQRKPVAESSALRAISVVQPPSFFQRVRC